MCCSKKYILRFSKFCSVYKILICPFSIKNPLFQRINATSLFFQCVLLVRDSRLSKQARSFAFVRALGLVWNHLYATCDSGTPSCFASWIGKAGKDAGRRHDTSAVPRFAGFLSPSFHSSVVSTSLEVARMHAMCGFVASHFDSQCDSHEPENEEWGLRFALTAFFLKSFLK